MFLLTIHGADFTDPLFWVIFIAIIAPCIIWVLIISSRSQKNLTALASRLGIAVTTNLRIATILREHAPDAFTLSRGISHGAEVGITGQVQARTVRFSEFTTGSGKATQHWTELAIAVSHNNLIFSLRPEGVLYKLAELAGFHEVKIGDAEFDRRWRIKANFPDTLCALLLPELRTKIDEQTIKGSYFVENGWLRYDESGHFSNNNRVLRMESMLPLMQDLACAIETAARNVHSP